MRLTPAGEVVLRRGRRALSQVEAIAADLQNLDQPGRAVIRVGVSQTSAAEIMPAALRRFHGEHPRTEVILTEMSDDASALAALVRGRLDLTFTYSAEPDERVVFTPVMEDPWVILLRDDDPAAELPDASFDILDGTDVVAWTRRWAAQVTLEDAWASLGIAPRIVYRTDDNLALQRFVAAGLGRACVGRLVARRAVDSSLTWLLPRQQLAERRIYLCTSRLSPPSPTAAGLVSAVLEQSRHSPPGA